MANFYQVFKNEPICQYAESYCEYDGDVEVVCGKCDRCVWKNNGGCSEWRRISGGEARLQHNAEKSFVECASCHARSDYYLISYRSRQTVL